jgi:3-oxoadipate enol-lactonase
LRPISGYSPEDLPELTHFVVAVGSASASPMLAASIGRVQEQAVVVGELRVVYRTAGQAELPPLVLLHALGDDGATWARVAGDLADSYRVYAPDLRGHGRTDWPGTYSFEAMRDDVVGFMDALGLDRVVLVGHSMGAAVAGMVAQQRPHRVTALVLEEPPPLPPIPERALPPRPEGPLSYDWAMVRAITAQRNRPDVGWWDRITAITAPTLVIGGGAESQIPQGRIAELARHIAHAQHMVINGGHEVHRNCPRQFTGAVRRFVATAAAQPPGEHRAAAERAGSQG